MFYYDEKCYNCFMPGSGVSGQTPEIAVEMSFI